MCREGPRSSYTRRTSGSRHYLLYLRYRFPPALLLLPPHISGLVLHSRSDVRGPNVRVRPRGPYSTPVQRDHPPPRVSSTRAPGRGQILGEHRRMMLRRWRYLPFISLSSSLSTRTFWYPDSFSLSLFYFSFLVINYFASQPDSPYFKLVMTVCKHIALTAACNMLSREVYRVIRNWSFFLLNVIALLREEELVGCTNNESSLDRSANCLPIDSRPRDRRRDIASVFVLVSKWPRYQLRAR